MCNEGRKLPTKGSSVLVPGISNMEQILWLTEGECSLLKMGENGHLKHDKSKDIGKPSSLQVYRWLVCSIDPGIYY